MDFLGQHLTVPSFMFLILALALALSFEFVNGFHDTANAVATVIYTHTLKPTYAVVWSGCWNLIGVLQSTGGVAFGVIALLPVELVIDDLFAYREELLEALPTAVGGKFKIGLPRAMSMLERLPFWKRYFAELNLEAVLSPVTDPRISAGGIELSVAEPCYPVQVAHGHVQALTSAGVDYVWLPVMADAEAGDDGCASHY